MKEALHEEGPDNDASSKGILTEVHFWQCRSETLSELLSQLQCQGNVTSVLPNNAIFRKLAQSCTHQISGLWTLRLHEVF